MDINKVKKIKEGKNWFLIRDGRQKAIVPKSWIREDGYFGKYISFKTTSHQGVKGWQIFDFNTGYERASKYLGKWYGDTLPEAISRVEQED